MPDHFDLGRVRAVESQGLGSLRVYGICRARPQHGGYFLVVESKLDKFKECISIGVKEDGCYHPSQIQALDSRLSLFHLVERTLLAMQLIDLRNPKIRKIRTSRGLDL